MVNAAVVTDYHGDDGQLSKWQIAWGNGHFYLFDTTIGEVVQELTGIRLEGDEIDIPPTEDYLPEILQHAYQLAEEGSTRICIMEESGVDAATADWIYRRHDLRLGPPKL
jgi:hypothetical protein